MARFREKFMVAELLKACIVLTGVTVTSSVVFKNLRLVNAGINIGLSSSLC